MYGLSFEKINVIIAYYEDILRSLLHEKKSNNDHFHPQFAIIVVHIKSYSSSVVKNKQTSLRFLVLE